jgi:hypothetical protein
MEAAMTDVTAPPDWYPDTHIPEFLRWWEGCTWTAFEASVEALALSPSTSPPIQSRADPRPARIPDLATTPPAGPCRHEGIVVEKQELEEEVAQLRQTLDELGVTERDRLWMELVDLNSQIPTLRCERNHLRTELVELGSRVPALRRERDELLATITPLSSEVTDLRGQQQELATLRSQIQELRHQRASLDAELVAQLRESTEQPSSTRSRHKFHDS